jgi:uncharacterized protein
MTPDTASRLVDALNEGLQNVESICIHFYGGEPLINMPAIRTMVQKVSAKPEGRFIFAITTNGTILNDSVIELLREGSFYTIVSIDGPKEIHDKCRRDHSGFPSHEKVMRFLHKVRESTNCHVRGSSVVRSGWSLVQAEEYLNSLGVDAIKAQAIRVAENSPLALKPSEFQNYLNHLQTIGDSIINDLENGQRPRDDRFSSRIFQLMTGTERKLYCQAGIRNFGIDPSGTVLSCILLDPKEATLGHIDDDPSIWVLAGKQWVDASIRESKCDDCSALPLCGGGCPAMTPVCGESECIITRANCDVARAIYSHFRDKQEVLLGLAGIF